MASNTEYLELQIRADRGALARHFSELLKTTTIITAGYDQSLDVYDQDLRVQSAMADLADQAMATIGLGIALSALEAVPRA